jgi:hypothetical protein
VLAIRALGSSEVAGDDVLCFLFRNVSEREALAISIFFIFAITLGPECYPLNILTSECSAGATDVPAGMPLSPQAFTMRVVFMVFRTRVVKLKIMIRD